MRYTIEAEQISLNEDLIADLEKAIERIKNEKLKVTRFSIECL